MHKIRFYLLAAAMASSSYALTWTDTTTTQPLKFLTGTSTNATFTSNFNILDNGYNPATMKVTSAIATFWFADDQPDADPAEIVDIYVNGFKLIAALEVNGAHPEVNFASYSASLNSVNDVNGLIAALQDGQVSYSVHLTNGNNGATSNSNGGDTYLKIASLAVTGTARTTPDSGTTAAMLGVGLMGLGMMRKRFGLTR